MAENTIDTLSLEIKSNANSAVNSIDKLAASLEKLQKSCGGVTGGLNNILNSFKSFSDSLKGVQLPENFNSFMEGIKALSSVNADDTGVNKLINALKRLTTADMSNFDSEKFNKIITSLSSLGNIPDVSSSVDRFVSALARLANAGLKAGDVAEKLPALGEALHRVTGDMADLAGVSDSVNLFVQSLARLASAGTKAEETAKGLEKLATETSKFFDAMYRAPAISENTIRMIQALAQLASAGGRVSSNLGNLANGMNSVGSSASRTKKHVFSLAAAFGKFYATYWLVLRGFRLFKKAIDISSDLTEVQNVVDVTFGDMKQKVEDLASVSIGDFGMSELTVKQISSRFQAMGVAMGITENQVRKASDFLKKNNTLYGETADSMADVSIELTKLAADMASFYNVEQEAVAEKLSSIFTGQTRPLRDFGLDLTQATLQEWALKQGLDADIKSMSQAEKTMLRFQYVMANSAASMGDYARTADTWHNSITRLGQAFEQLGSVIGGALINTFKPIVSWLNRTMQSIIAFAQTVVNALGKIFGWTYEVKGGGISNDFEDAGVGAEEMADGTGKAKDNLEEMQKYIAAWHEVNNMTTKDDDDGGGKGGAGGAGGAAGGGLADRLIQTDGLLEKYKSDIDSLYELGDYIGKVLTNAMNRINWDSVYEGARNFGTGLADFLNGLISPELFGAVGRTIAGALNTAIYAALAFGERFDWKDFGLSIATGVNEFFRTFDFKSLGSTINAWAKGILDTIITAIDNINWGMIGTQIGTFLAEIDLFQILGKIGKAIWKAINASFELYEGMFETAPFETALLTLAGLTKLLKTKSITKFITALKGGITTAVNFGKALLGSQTALESLRVGFPKLTKVIELSRKAFANFRFTLSQSGSLMTAFGEGFNTIRNNMTNMQKGITTAAAAFAEFMIVKDSVKDIVTGTGNLAVNLLELGSAAGIAGAAMYAALGPAGIAIAAITGLIAAFVGVKSAIDDIEAESAMNAVGNALKNPGGTPLDQITASYQEMVNGISDSFDKINEKAEELDATKQHAKETSESIDLIKFAVENGSSVAEEKIPELNQLFNDLLTDSKSIFEQEYDVIMLGISGSLQQSLIDAGYSIEQIVGMMDSLKSSHQQAIDEITQKNSELERSYANGEISNEEYTAAMMENYSQLAELTGKTDEYADAVSGVSDAVSGIDFSKFINEDNTLNTAALADQFNRLSDTANEAKESIALSSDGLTSALSDYESEALRIGNSEAATVISDAISLEAQNVDLAVTEVDKSLLAYADTVQTGLLEKIPDVVDEALADYENQSWLYKLTHTEADHVQAALDKYQSEVIDPATESLESMYSEVGIEGAGWAADASSDIITSLFSVNQAELDMGVTQQTTTLNEAYREVVEGAVEGLSERAKEFGTETGENLTSGIAEGAKAGRSLDLIKNSATEAVNAYKQYSDEAGQINSPSKLMMPTGMYLLQGIIEGFKGAISQWTASISSWASETYANFQTNVTSTISDVTTWFSELPEKIYTAIFPTNERVTTWGGGVLTTFQENVTNAITSVTNWFSQMPGKIYNAILTFITQTLPQWKSGIDNFFGSAIPNIISDVVHLFSGIGKSLVPIGENIIRGLWEGISNLTGWIGDKIGGFCQGILNKFRKGFDEHSPSKEAFKIGDYFTLGLENGLINRFSDVYGDVESFARDITSIKFDAPKLDYSVPVVQEYSHQYSDSDMDRMKSTLQMEMDEKLAQAAYENQQLQQAVERNTQILEQILSQGIVLDDNTFINKYKRASTKFYNQHRYEMGLYPAGR